MPTFYNSIYNIYYVYNLYLYHLYLLCLYIIPLLYLWCLYFIPLSIISILSIFYFSIYYIYDVCILYLYLLYLFCLYCIHYVYIHAFLEHFTCGEGGAHLVLFQPNTPYLLIQSIFLYWTLGDGSFVIRLSIIQKTIDTT